MPSLDSSSHQAEDVARGLDHRDAVAHHFLGQLRLGDREAILHLDRGEVLIGADLERDRDAARAVVGALRAVVNQVLDAAELLLDRRGDRLRHCLGIGPHVDGVDLNLGRGDFGITGNRQHVDRYRTCDQDQQRQHDGEHRPIDKEPRNHGLLACLSGWSRTGREPGCA